MPTEILVLGDSHAEVFRHPAFPASFPDRTFRVVAVGGATASGLENPNSKTQAYPLFRQALDNGRPARILVLLGEVDTGFVIWWRAVKYGAPVAEMARRAVENYGRLLLEAAAVAPVICVSTPLPTIQDGFDFGAVANARKEVKASLRERTELTLWFNAEMAEFCRSRGLVHVGLDGASLGPDGTVAKLLLNPDPRDHHYDKDKYTALLIPALAASGALGP